MEKIFQSREIKTDINDKLITREELMKKKYDFGPWPDYSEKNKENENKNNK